MARYDKLIGELTRLGLRGNSEPMPAADIAALRDEYPGIPEDYLDFLEQVGWGGFGDDWLMVYNGPSKPDDIFDDETSRELGRVLFVADDFSGNHLGYFPDDGWRLAEVDSADLSDFDSGTFESEMWERLRRETEG